MNISRGLWISFATLAVVLGVALFGYAAQAGVAEPQGHSSQPAAGGELPPVGTVEVPAPAASASALTVPASGSGRFVPAPGGSAPVGTGRITRYTVVVEEGAA